MSINKKNIATDDLRTMDMYGTVVDIADPLKRGRARVRVMGKFDALDVEDIPWAEPATGFSFGDKGGHGSLSIPKLDAVVKVRFDNGIIYSPVFTGIVEPSPDMLEAIKDSYEGAHSLIHDAQEDLQIYYTREKGLTLSLLGSTINIASDNAITIEHVGTSAIIELRGGTCSITTDSEIELTAGSRIKASAPEVWLDGKQTKNGHVPSYSHVLGEPLWVFLKTLAAAVDAKMYPSPGAMASAATMAEQLSLSSTCKVSK